LADPSTFTMAETLSILLIMAGLCILPLVMVAGLALLRRWEHAPHKRDAAIKRDMDQLERRIAELETGYSELARMQERLDFLEAVLEAGPSRAQLPGAGQPVERG
jgi:Tfp pilus assembly protein PilN